MARKTRKTEEADYEVTIKDTSMGATTPKKTATVKAPTPDAAIDAATDNKPVPGAEEVTVKKTDPQGSSTGVVSEKAPSLSMKAITEAVEYPYSISLPEQFRKFLAETGLEYRNVGNTLTMKFENKTQLTEALRTLRKSKSEKAGVVLDGINRSLM